MLSLVVNLVTSPISYNIFFIPQDISRIVFGFQLDNFVIRIVVVVVVFDDDHFIIIILLTIT